MLLKFFRIPIKVYRIVETMSLLFVNTIKNAPTTLLFLFKIFLSVKSRCWVNRIFTWMFGGLWHIVFFLFPLYIFLLSFLNKKISNNFGVYPGNIVCDVCIYSWQFRSCASNAPRNNSDNRALPVLKKRRKSNSGFFNHPQRVI